MGYDTTIGADGWPVDGNYPTIRVEKNDRHFQIWISQVFAAYLLADPNFIRLLT